LLTIVYIYTANKRYMMKWSIVATFLSSFIWIPILTAFTYNSPISRSKKAITLLNARGGRGNGLPKPDVEDPERFVPPQSFDVNSFYPSNKTLMRAGPIPFLTRLTNPDKYEQAVLKYMYQSKEYDFQEAQANMDAYFSSPTDWAEQKMMEQRGERPKFRYADAAVDESRAVLTFVWAGFVAYVVGKIVYTAITGGYDWDTLFLPKNV